MTYDNPGRSFTGRFRSSSKPAARQGHSAAGPAAAVTLSPTDSDMAFSRFDDSSDGNQHVMVLVQGTAAGQWRWVTGYTGAGRFVLDRPFDVEPDKDALMVVDVAKAQNIHFRNTLKDVGNFQFFGSVIDTDVVENVGERMGGFFSWGQLHRNATFIGPQNLSTPDLYVQWLGNEVIEGNTCRNYRKHMAEVTPGWGEWGFNGFTFAVIADPQKLLNGSDPDGLTKTMLDRFIVMRGNVVHNNGGIAVGATSESKGPAGLIGDVLVEHNRIRLSDAKDVVVNETQCPTAFVRANGGGVVRSPAALQFDSGVAGPSSEHRDRIPLRLKFDDSKGDDEYGGSAADGAVGCVVFERLSVVGSSNRSHFQFPAIAVSLPNGHVVLSVCRSGDGHVCSPGIPGVCGQVTRSVDGGESFRVQRTVAEGGTGSFNGPGDLGQPLPPFPSASQSQHQGNRSSGFATFRTLVGNNGGSWLNASRPMAVQHWRDGATALTLERNESCALLGTPRGFLGLGQAGSIVRLRDGALLAGFYGSAPGHKGQASEAISALLRRRSDRAVCVCVCVEGGDGTTAAPGQRGAQWSARVR